MTHQKVNATVFLSYIEDETGAIVKAAQVTESDVVQVRKFWEKPDAVIGDFIILEPNGSAVLLKSDAFLELYRRPQVRV